MLTTENWIALFCIFSVPFIAAILNLRHRIKEHRLQYSQLNDAYLALNHEFSERTQNLRAVNNSLHGEITQHEKTEEKLHQSENYLNSIIDSMPSILIGVTRGGHITHWNKSAEKDSQLKEVEVLGKTLWEVAPHLPIDLHMVHESIDQKIPKQKQNHKLTKNDETHYLDIAIYPLLVESAQDTYFDEAIIQIDDVTMQVMMENIIIQNEKMLSLGELAAGMAHEINNPLGAILQSVQNIERRFSKDLKQNIATAESTGLSMDALEEYLAERKINNFLTSIRDAGERSARIVSNMLEFSHRSQQHNWVDINELLNHCLELTENNFKTKGDYGTIPIAVKTIFQDELPLISCSAAEIQQVILNLLRNAIHCFSYLKIPPQKPTITIKTAQEANQVTIKIIDNGPGMPEEIAKHIFEPFFTTKEVGEGTGLGLSISYFIITKHHNGNIAVDSKQGEGTTFSVTLPIEAQTVNDES